MREWQYWTRNKLSILAGYLPAFNVASSTRSPERLYIDLMAGEPFNRDKETGEEFDGSARLALSSAPPFTRVALCEMPQKAAALEAKDKRSRDAGLDTLFDLPATSIPVESLAWEPTDSWDPATRSWWHQEPDSPA